MSEGQAGSGLPPSTAEPADDPAPARRATDPAALLLAVERVGADVNALARALAAQPEEVAARLDVDATTASIGLRVGALDSSLDHLRLSLLASLDRTAGRLDTPVWLPALQAALTDVTTKVAGADGVRAEVAELRAAVERSLARTEADERLTRVERAVTQLVERVAPVPDRLGAIASQVDRLTPLARAGDQARSLYDRLDTVGSGLEEVIRLLRARRPDAGDGAGGEGDGGPDAVADVLAEVISRQDELTAAVTTLLDQARVITARVEQQERTLVLRLDQIDASLRDVDEAAAEEEGEAASLLRSVLDHMKQQEASTDRRDELTAAVSTRLEEEREPKATGDELAALARRQDELAAAIASLADQMRGPVAVDAVFDRMEQRERSLAARLDRIDLQLRSDGAPTRAGASKTLPTSGGEADPNAEDVASSLAGSVEAIAGVAQDLAGLVESTADRLDRRLSAVEVAARQTAVRTIPRKLAPVLRSASAEAAALRLADLRAERARVQDRLQEERLLAAQALDDAP